MASIQGIYIALFGRPADPLGLDYFNQVTSNGANLSAINGLTGTAEYLDRFEGMNSSQVVTSIYQELFGRNPDAAGLAYFVAQLQSGAQTIETIAINILDGAQNEDADLVAAKEALADQFTAAVRADPDALAAYQGPDGIAYGQSFIDQITGPDFTLTDAEVAQQVADFGDGIGGPTNPVNFTDAIGEALVGTAGSDTFTGVIGDGTTGTIQFGDTVDGLGGRDTLNIFVTAAAAGLPAGVAVKGVEIININGDIGADVDASAFVGATEVWQIGAVNDISSVGETTVAGFRAVEADVAVTFTGAAGAIALDMVEDGSDITVDGASLVDLTISGTVDDDGANPAGPGALSLLAGADLEAIETLTLNLTSDTIVDVSDLTSIEGFTTIDASGSTGGIEIDAYDYFTSVVLGSGDDNLDTGIYGSTGDYTDTITIDMGAGDDYLYLDLENNGTNAIALTASLGEGNDDLEIGYIENIFSAAEDDFESSLAIISDFDPSEDVIDVSGVDTATVDLTFEVLINTEAAAIADSDTLFDAVELAAGYLDGTNFGVTFDYDGDAYIFVDADEDGTFSDGDGLVQLTGISVADLSASNFVTA